MNALPVFAGHMKTYIWLYLAKKKGRPARSRKDELKVSLLKIIL